MSRKTAINVWQNGDEVPHYQKIYNANEFRRDINVGSRELPYTWAKVNDKGHE
jgi:hypothetical protein